MQPAHLNCATLAQQAQGGNFEIYPYRWGKRFTLKGGGHGLHEIIQPDQGLTVAF
jgi:hypothetical protein